MKQLELDVRGQKKLMHKVLMKDWLHDRLTPVESLMEINGHQIKGHTARISELRKIYRRQGFELMCIDKNFKVGVRPTFYTLKALEELEAKEKKVVQIKTQNLLQRLRKNITTIYS